MKEVTANVEQIAACGLYCGACGKFLKNKCPGCAKNEKASWCKIRSCCKTGNISTCAECSEHINPDECGKFNNFISKIIGFILNSDRKDCIKQIREKGLIGHAEIMASNRQRTIKRK